MIYLVLPLLVLCQFAAAAETGGVSSLKLPGSDMSTYADHKNYFSSGIVGAQRSGVSLGYGRLLNDQFMVGLMGIWTGSYSESKEGGNLSQSQYYREEYTESSNMAEVNGTFYFRDQGYARWGFLMKGAVGHSWHKAKATWDRYDRDPAIFVLFGDGKRLRESGGHERKWQSTFVRAGAYYQMAFNFHPAAKVGHILQFGVTGWKADQKKTLSYTKPNGESFSKTVPDSAAGGEISYTLSF